MEQTETKKLKLNLEQYLNIKAMFDSPDTENRTVALSILSELDVKSNLIYFMILLKETKMGYDWWYKNMTSVMSTLNNIISNKKNICFLSYTDILNLGVAYNVPMEDIEFIINRQVWFTLYKYTPDRYYSVTDVKLEIITNEKRSVSQSM
jgi:hypothetical protein